MTKVSENIFLKRWTLYLQEILDKDMVEDLKPSYGDELAESCAKLLNIVDVCKREEVTLTPEMAAGVLVSVLAECAAILLFPEDDELMNLGFLLARETGFMYGA